MGEVFALASRWLPESCALRRFFALRAHAESQQSKADPRARRELSLWLAMSLIFLALQAPALRLFPRAPAPTACATPLSAANGLGAV